MAMATWKKFVMGAALALSTVSGVGCGGAELPPPVVQPVPDAGVQDPVPVEARRLSTMGEVRVVDGIAQVRLVLYADGMLADGLSVEVAGHALEAGLLPGRYETSFTLEGESSAQLQLVMRDGDDETRQTIVLPGAFSVTAASPIIKGDSISISWSEADAATGYGVRLTPPGTTEPQRGQLLPDARAFTFSAAQTEGEASVEVTAVHTHEPDHEGRAIVARRIVSTTVTVNAPAVEQPAPQLDLSGRITFADGFAVANLDVMADGQWALDAEVTLEGHALTFVPEHSGYYAQLRAEDLPQNGSLEVAVSLGDTRATRTLLVPGAFEVKAPQQALAGSPFAFAWSQSPNATGYRLHFSSEATWLGSAELDSGVRKYLMSIGAPARVTTHLSAVTQNPGDNDRSRVEVLRMQRFVFDVLAP